MRASPAFAVSLHRFGVWCGAVWLLGALGVAVITAWFLTREAPIHPAVIGAGVVAAAAVLWLATDLARVPAVGLRWDGQLWHVGAPGASAEDSAPGEMAVVIDLGTWMLLRFRPTVSVPCRRATWLPVQRRGIEGQWHALRCSVHSPHPAPGRDTLRRP